MKELPKHLKYTFLGAKETYPVIIASDLAPKDEVTFGKGTLKTKESYRLEFRRFKGELAPPCACIISTWRTGLNPSKRHKEGSTHICKRSSKRRF